MNKITRPAEPDFLVENASKWNDAFAENRKKDKNFVFQWRTYQKQKVNILLLPTLRSMTQGHCAFCDGYPFSMSKETIEHFRPKGKFPKMAYTWENLFLCCNACQSAKGENFEDTLLKPDESDYQFSDYFQCNFKTGELEPNATATDTQKTRAHDTIRLYDFNSMANCITRLNMADAWEAGKAIGYRYFI